MPRSQRARSSRAINNDELILDAAITEILRVGVDHTSLRDVAHQAGLTHGATYARYEDVDELFVDLWNTRLCARLTEMFDLCMAAADEPSSVRVSTLFHYIRNASTTDVVAIHLLFTARRIPTLLEEVEVFFEHYLRRTPYDADPRSATFSRGMILYAVTLMHVFANARLGRDDDYLDVLEGLIFETLTEDPHHIAPTTLRSPKEELSITYRDDLDAQLTFATLSVVGKSGYTRATISRIARRAQCSPGAIYKLYPSKEDLVIATLTKLMKARWMRVGNFVEILEEGSITQLLYAAASRENELRMNFALETGLTAFQSDKLQQAILHQVDDLLSIAPQLTNITFDEGQRLGHLIRAISFVTIGVTFFSAATQSLNGAQFFQFGEPFRRAMLNNGVPTWREISRQIRELVAQRDY